MITGIHTKIPLIRNLLLEIRYKQFGTPTNVAALKGSSSGSTDTFREKGRQNELPYVKFGLVSSV